MGRHKQQIYLVHFYNTLSIFVILYIFERLFFFMIIVNIFKYFMSCYLFTFSNTRFILNTSYFFEILPNFSEIIAKF